MRGLARWALLAGLALVACRAPRPNVDPVPGPEADGFSLTLNNHHLLDVNIFLQHDGQVDRLALVTAATSKTLVLPLYMLGQGGAIRLIAEPIGDDTRYTTDILTVQPGQMVQLDVENPIPRSNYSIQ
jgi:hypothetical protein